MGKLPGLDRTQANRHPSGIGEGSLVILLDLRVSKNIDEVFIGEHCVDPVVGPAAGGRFGLSSYCRVKNKLYKATVINNWAIPQPLMETSAYAR